ncbi:hypothetical protein GCM10011344_44960 [Dokdonia pacifica]|uniref:Leucine rich repeat-containing protein n=1 Tax=Dokdonia pacifica TaxID=1627892 RepID=A0A239CRP0_9FLAO|nr:hypothetical protein [Dokdonia pacifica]GGG39094.1 hypothetical protein GCM10011344_44960 [Dokdonia pacifica]SNS22154.1 hypothetical protein SAMN06265376_108126 [Dokdonia pacifica]
MKSSKFIFPVLLSVIAFSSTSCGDDDADITPIEPTAQEVQRTLIPDPAFEAALIELNLDNELDGSVPTENIEDVMDLVLNEKGISDLTGIEGFTNLYNLWLNDNQLSEIDLSQNNRVKFIFLENNSISTIDVSNMPNLEKLELKGNTISEIDVTTNQQLQFLILDGNNINALDVSNNPELFTLEVLNNPLSCIKVSQSQLENTPSNWVLDTNDTLSLDCN